MKCPSSHWKSGSGRSIIFQFYYDLIRGQRFDWHLHKVRQENIKTNKNCMRLSHSNWTPGSYAKSDQSSAVSDPPYHVIHGAASDVKLSAWNDDGNISFGVEIIILLLPSGSFLMKNQLNPDYVSAASIKEATKVARQSICRPACNDYNSSKGRN